MIYNSTIIDWHGSGAFGLRRLAALAPAAAIGLALLLQALWRRGALLPLTLIGLMAAWTIVLQMRYDLYLISHDFWEVYRMPPAALYLSYDALPLDRVGDWLRGAYFLSRPFARMAPGVAVGTLMIFGVMGVALASVAVVARRMIGR
jgi:hypothetical protein